MQFILKPIVRYLLQGIDVSQPKGECLYEGVAHHMVNVTVEAVLFKKKDGVRHVFLTRRQIGQSLMGMWTLPGTTLRPRDEDLDNAAYRVLRDELDCSPLEAVRVKDTSPPIWEGERGPMLSLPYIIAFDGDPKCNGGKWHPVSNLPLTLHGVHHDLIKAALKEVEAT